MSKQRRSDKFVGGRKEARALLRAMDDAVEEPLEDEATDDVDDEEEVVGVATGEDYDPDWEPSPTGKSSPTSNYDPHQPRDDHGKWHETPAAPRGTRLDEGKARVELSDHMPVDEAANDEILRRDDGSYGGRRTYVKLADLIATQRTVDPKKVNFFADNPRVRGGEEVLIWEMNGKKYIGDGHHRVLAAKLRGDDDIRATYSVFRED